MNDYKIRIKFASPEEIEKWAFGRITESETLNYRTLKPVNGGLFCAQIFGPVNDYECLCRRYRGYKYDGVVCERCNVQVTSSSVRRSRMGYIKLPMPVVHPWFFRNNNKIAVLIDISLKDLKKIANLEKYVVFEPGKTGLFVNDMITMGEFDQHMFTEGFVAETGGLALKALLEKVDLDEKIQKAKDILKKEPSILVKKKYRMLLDLCEGMKSSNIRPEWMIISNIAVIPPDLRPLVEIEGGKFVSSDINELYRTVIYRVKRLESLIKNQIIIPLILHNEIRMLQEGVNKLFGYGAETDSKDFVKKYKSLEDRIKGKEGSLRKSMLGKREDFSGRTVIVIEPTLKLDECILPKEMALEILKPAVIGYLRLYGFASSIKQAKRLIESKRPEVWDVLNEIIESRFPVVLLNRAPTLHRIGIMAFRVKLWDKKCLGIHPLVCPAFNADFDGDTMSIHWPLSEEAKAEAWELMKPSSNLGSSTSGNLIVGAFRDIAFGIYSLSLCDDFDSKYFVASTSQMDMLLLENKIQINNVINYLLEDNQIIKTTPGRVMLWNILPKHKELPFSEVNQDLTSKHVHDLMKKIRIIFGDQALSKFADDIKDLGFKYGNYSTGSIGKDDLFEIPEAKKLVKESIQKQINLKILFEDGMINFNEMQKKTDDLWKKTQATGKQFLENMIKDQKFNPLVTISKSGARGSIQQMLQILFLKGNVLDISGQFSIIPIWKSHKEGLTMDQYFLLSSGGRKAVADVALKTAESGYLTRRLVEVAHDVVINEVDCETKNYIVARNIFREGVLQSMVYDKILKRVSALEIKNPATGKVLVNKGALIDEKIVELLQKHEVTEVAIRSPSLCELSKGICANCYGGDLSSISDLVCLGEAVGVIAAQSIGEPGTQLTMKSFHAGGVASFGFIETVAKTPFAGTVYFQNARIIKNLAGEDINISRDFKIFIKNQYGLILADFTIPYGAKICVKEGEEIEIDFAFAKWSPETPIIAETDGICEFMNLQLGLNCEDVNDDFGQRKTLVLPHKQLPFLIMKTHQTKEESSYFLPPNTVINVLEGDHVKSGTILAYTRQQSSVIDIVGGLQKVVNILENRPPAQAAILAPIDGVVKIQSDKKDKKIICLINEIGEEIEISVGDVNLSVQNEQIVKKGDLLTSGIPLTQDILDYRGMESLIEHFIKELQNIYLVEHGLKINDKHLEVILHQMCRKFEIVDGGNTSIIGKHLDKHEMTEINNQLSLKHKQQLSGRRLINGITNISLESTSFLSSASFQETINVITWSGLIGAEDDLSSIKSSIIAGTLIKAGTGFAYDIFKKLGKELQKET